MNQTHVPQNDTGMVVNVERGTICRVQEDTGEICLLKTSPHPKPESVREGIIRRCYFRIEDLKTDLESLAKRCGLHVRMFHPAAQKTEFIFE